MQEEKVKEAIMQLTMAAALMREAKKVLQREGVLLADFTDHLRFSEPAFLIINKGKYVEAGIAEIAEAIGATVEHTVHSNNVSTNGITLFEMVEEKEDGTDE